MTDTNRQPTVIDALRELDSALVSKAYTEEQLEKDREQARAAQARLEELLGADRDIAATLAQGGAIELTRHRLEVEAGPHGNRIQIAPLEKTRTVWELARDLEVQDAF